MYFVLRNNQKFGPYPVSALKAYVEEGKILLNDQAMPNHSNEIKTVRAYLKQNNVSVKIKSNGSVINQVKKIGKDLIVPGLEFIKKDLIKDKKLIYLASIGLAPAFLITFTFGTLLTFYAISLYFSVIWGIFFYYMFSTKQVTTRNTILLFFLTQITAFILVNLQSFPPLSYLYAFTESNNILLRLIGYVLGVGVTEETIKALPLLFLIRSSKEPLVPQTVVFYGLISGIGFGVLEGVHYQTTTNTTLSYDAAFFMNVARLTCLPFLHAIWAGIAGYFISFANIIPKYRQSLYLLAIGIPAILHGIYDVLGWSIPGLISTLFSVLLLIYYLKRSRDYQSKLIQLQ
ncbi:MAG: PrsW family glutamic-type intramembrane protease [Bacteroidota bacterium]